MIKKIYKLALAASLFLGVGAAKMNAQTPDAGKATVGHGLYKDRIYWLNFDVNKDGAQGDAITDGLVRTFTSPAGIQYTATISNVVNSPVSYSTYDYWGNNFPSGYGQIGGNEGAGNIIGFGATGSIARLRVTMSAKYPDGSIKNVAAFVIGGTESLGGTFNPADPNVGEWYSITVPSTSPTPKLLDKVIRTLQSDYNPTAADWANFDVDLYYTNGGKTITGANTNGGDTQGDVLLIAEDTPYIDVAVKGGGKQHVAVGFMEDLDFGDAPASYGNAAHLVNQSLTGGLIAPTTDTMVDLPAVSNTEDTNLTKFDAPLLRMGSLVDVETTPYNTANADGDDLTGIIDDEEALQYVNWNTCLGKINVLNKTGQTAYLHVWIDANKNGIFDANEVVTTTVPTGTGTADNQAVEVAFPMDAITNLVRGTSYYVRARISTESSPVAASLMPNGEVEDHMINIVSPTTTIARRTDNGCTTFATITFENMPVDPNGKNWTLYESKDGGVTYTQIASANTATFVVNDRLVGTYTYKVINGEGCTYNLDPVEIKPLSCAKDDSYLNVPFSGTPQVLGNVLSNDLYNATSITASGTNTIKVLTDNSNGQVTIGPDGKITLGANPIPGFTYTLTYEVCHADGTGYVSCATATLTITTDKDNDGDGISDQLDLDDDNDGISDLDECPACPATTRFTNGSFETNTWGAASGQAQISATRVPGWKTTDTTNTIEIWGPSPNATTGSSNVVAQDGRYFVELAAEQASTLYQEFCIPTNGGKLYWSIYHAARGLNATDKAQVRIGPSLTDYTVVANMETKQSSGWVRYSGTMDIPASAAAAGKWLIMFADNSGNPNNTFGNFIDNVTVTFDPVCTDFDGDGIPNSKDTDADNDGCPDAVEGSENVTPSMVWPLTLPSSDANYANRGRIKVTYDGATTAANQAGVISNSPSAIGVPQVVNPAGVNLNTTTNATNLVGVADNTDGTVDVGQGIGEAYNATLQSGCFCYKPAATGTPLDTKHGITGLGRAGSSTATAKANKQDDNWPMARKSAYTALESKTKGFVITRMTTAQVTAIANPVEGMMVFDTEANAGEGCLKLYDGTKWNCLQQQTCDNTNF